MDLFGGQNPWVSEMDQFLSRLGDTVTAFVVQKSTETGTPNSVNIRPVNGETPCNPGPVGTGPYYRNPSLYNRSQNRSHLQAFT